MKTKVMLLIIIGITALLHLFKINSLPICLNSDEAAFGYNAYSILKTGKDEYGITLPLRLKSFGDYKLPLYTYLSVPFVGVMGLSELSIRSLAILLGILFPLAMFFLTKELFEDERMALLSAFLVGLSPWIQITSRHAHEVILAAFLLTIAAAVLLKYIKTADRRFLVAFSILELLSLFSYHISRPIVLGMLLFLGLHVLRKKSEIVIAALPFLLFTLTDIIYNPTRIKNLIFFNDGGFKLAISQKLIERNIPMLYNPITQALIDLPKEYIKYFSPEFLVVHGDTNFRFGHPGISPISIIEYLFIFVGLFYVFKKRPTYGPFLLLLILIAPLAASLSFFEYSSTRSFFLVVPLIALISYGVISFLKDIPKRFYLVVTTIITISFLFFNLSTWDFYFFHYPHRAVATRAWQCGYKELTQYVSNNYQKFNRFNITTRNGEPYIFFLFYLKYPPEKYQKQATLSPPDQYGFGQVWEFDKFDFQFNLDHPLTQTSYIGYPEHFKDKNNIDASKIQKITSGTEEIFYIYER